MVESRRPWTREELLVVLRLYLQTDFGRLHSGNPVIRALAARLGRTPGAVAMKATNFASLDPKITGSGRRGLRGASATDREVWEFMRRSLDEFEDESARLVTGVQLSGGESVVAEPSESIRMMSIDEEMVLPSAEQTAAKGSVTQRRKQGFFRRLVLAAYRDSCAVSGVDVPELLNASHIIPWRADPSRRLDPTNGIALNALYDRAFDRGLITFDSELRVIVSTRLARGPISAMQRALLVGIAGEKAARPVRFDPDPSALEYHRDTVFRP